MSASPGIFQPNLNNVAVFLDLYGKGGIVATPSGTQATAIALGQQFSKVVTVASAGDAVRLGRTNLGRGNVVWNAAAANSLNIYPESGEQINALGVNNAFALPAGAMVWFWSADNGSGTWYAAYIAPGVAQPLLADNATAITSGTLTGANVAGAQFVTLTSSGATALNSPTAAAMLAAISNGAVGATWRLRIVNTNGGTFTITWDATVTQTGGANTITTNTWREYDMAITGAATATAKGAGTGTFS